MRQLSCLNTDLRIFSSASVLFSRLKEIAECYIIIIINEQNLTNEIQFFNNDVNILSLYSFSLASVIFLLVSNWKNKDHREGKKIGLKTGSLCIMRSSWPFYLYSHYTTAHYTLS